MLDRCLIRHRYDSLRYPDFISVCDQKWQRGGLGGSSPRMEPGRGGSATPGRAGGHGSAGSQAVGAAGGAKPIKIYELGTDFRGVGVDPQR